METRQKLIDTILTLQDDVRELMYKNSDFYAITDYDMINSDINSYAENDFESFKSNKDLKEYITYLKKDVLKKS